MCLSLVVYSTRVMICLNFPAYLREKNFHAHAYLRPRIISYPLFVKAKFYGVPSCVYEKLGCAKGDKVCGILIQTKEKVKEINFTWKLPCLPSRRWYKLVCFTDLGSVFLCMSTIQVVEWILVVFIWYWIQPIVFFVKNLATTEVGTRVTSLAYTQEEISWLKIITFIRNMMFIAFI